MADKKRNRQKGSTPKGANKQGGWQKNLEAVLANKDAVQALKTLLGGSDDAAPHCFHFFVLNSMSTKPQLPIKIAAHAPHMTLLLGLPNATFQPGLKTVVDTGSVISVGWAPFILAICFAHF